MRIRTRYLLAATLVATTLCVDRVTVAEARVDAAPSRGLVDRLTDGFRRTVASRPIVRQRCLGSVPLARPSVVVRTAAAVPADVCPACLPLPPPVA